MNAGVSASEGRSRHASGGSRRQILSVLASYTVSIAPETIQDLQRHPRELCLARPRHLLLSASRGTARRSPISNHPMSKTCCASTSS